MNILIVLTSLDQLGDTGKKTGFRMEEFVAPYYVLKDAGATIILASPKNGRPAFPRTISMRSFTPADMALCGTCPITGHLSH